jgi:hypothetical protein
MRRSLVAILVLAACGSDPPAPEPTHLLHGTLQAPACGDGYDILNANVTLRDDENHVIGTATTVLVDRELGFAGMVESCTSEFSIDDVPERDFYQMKIGTHDGPTYTLAEMKAQDWDISLSLD